MHRLKDDFIEILESKLHLHCKKVLEIGCGTGSRSVQLGERCHSLYAIDPDSKALRQAEELNKRPNITYSVDSAEKLAFDKDTFDIVIFTLSFHHVPQTQMRNALEESARVTKPDGSVVFLEPTHVGTFFEAELTFDACDGDEREAKDAAHKAMLDAHDILEPVEEIPDETIMKFDSYDDLLDVMKPSKHLDKLVDFLSDHNSILSAQRRINIFKVRRLKF